MPLHVHRFFHTVPFYIRNELFHKDIIMRRLFFIFLIAVLASPVYAAPVQDASIEKLLTLTDAKKLHESVMSDSDEIVDSTLKPMLLREKPTPEQKAFIDSFLTKYKKIMKDELSWEKMMPSYIRIYRETFTEKELNELIAFYESPTGKMFVKKTPVILEKTSSVMQQKMVSILSKMNAMLEDSKKDMSVKH